MTQTRMTKQRSVILEALRSVKTHPTADEIYGLVRKKLPRISLGTVYRNLDVLTSTGEIRILERAGSQKRFDGDLTPHQHVRCETCGTVGDIFPPVNIPRVPQANAAGFYLKQAEIEFIGLCPNCVHIYNRSE